MEKATEHPLVTIGKARFQESRDNPPHLADHAVRISLVNDIKNYPHAFVLACCMTRQISADRAWEVPIKIYDILGDFNVESLVKISLVKYRGIFNEHKLHRYNNLMSEVFYRAVQRIANDYDGDASKIWDGTPTSSAVVSRFLQFYGVGIKIATMAANILVRQFNIPFSDYNSIDISPDVQVVRVFRRSGLVEKEASINSIIYKARELNPEFPGVIDFSCWEIGRTWCRPKNPNCTECVIREVCVKQIV